jgi:hypothetical protein
MIEASHSFEILNDVSLESFGLSYEDIYPGPASCKFAFLARLLDRPPTTRGRLAVALALASSLRPASPNLTEISINQLASNHT